MLALVCGLARAESATPPLTSASPTAASVPAPVPEASPAAPTEGANPKAGDAAQPASSPAAPSSMQSAAAALMKLAKSNTKPLDKEQVGTWLESIRHMLDVSQPAQQIQASGNTQAIAMREEARSLYRAAKEAFDAGDIVKPQELLPKAAATFIQSVQLITPKPDPVKVKASLNADLEPVKALFGVYKRVLSQRAPLQGMEDTTRTIEKLLADVEQLIAADYFREARMLLDKAYLLTKAVMSSLHVDAQGAPVKFASKEEEFGFELDRNNTHQRLIRILLGEKRSAAEVDPSVKGNMDKARALRGQADTAAERKEYPDAIKMFGDSTAELVQAIRKLGVFVPG